MAIISHLWGKFRRTDWEVHLCLHHVYSVPELEGGVKYTLKNYKRGGMNGDNEWRFPGSQDYHIFRKIIIDSLFVENLNKLFFCIRTHWTIRHPQSLRLGEGKRKEYSN